MFPAVALLCYRQRSEGQLKRPSVPPLLLKKKVLLISKFIACAKRHHKIEQHSVLHKRQPIPDSRAQGLLGLEELFLERNQTPRRKPSLRSQVHRARFDAFQEQAVVWIDTNCFRNMLGVKGLLNHRRHRHVRNCAHIIHTLLGSAGDFERLLHRLKRTKLEGHFPRFIIRSNHERKKAFEHRRRDICSHAAVETNFAFGRLARELTSERNPKLMAKVINTTLHFFLQSGMLFCFLALFQVRNGALVLLLL